MQITIQDLFQDDKKKDIPNFEGLYAIARNGKVWSYNKCSKSGCWIQSCYDIKRKQLTMSLYKRKKQHKFLISYLVAITYLPNDNNFKYVKHLDGNKLNNHICNLKWSESL